MLTNHMRFLVTRLRNAKTQLGLINAYYENRNYVIWCSRTQTNSIYLCELEL